MRAFAVLVFALAHAQLLTVCRCAAAEHISDHLTAYDNYRTQLESLWSERWSERLPCAKPSKTGHLRKEATLSQSRTLRLRAPYKRSFVAEQAPVYHGCQVCAAFICFCVYREVADDCSAFRSFCFLRFSEVGSRKRAGIGAGVRCSALKLAC